MNIDTFCLKFVQIRDNRWVIHSNIQVLLTEIPEICACLWRTSELACTAKLDWAASPWITQFRLIPRQYDSRHLRTQALKLTKVHGRCSTVVASISFFCLSVLVDKHVYFSLNNAHGSLSPAKLPICLRLGLWLVDVRAWVWSQEIN
jgi:hypothetical protein